MLRLLLVLLLLVPAFAQVNRLAIIPSGSDTGEVLFQTNTLLPPYRYVALRGPLSIPSATSFHLRLPDAAPAADDCLKAGALTSGSYPLRFEPCGGGLPVVDTINIVKGSADATKLLRFEVDGFTTATTRVLTPQNADYTVAGTNITNTFSADQLFNNNMKIHWKDADGNTVTYLWVDGINNFQIGSQSAPQSGGVPVNGDLVFRSRGTQLLTLENSAGYRLRPWAGTSVDLGSSTNRFNTAYLLSVEASEASGFAPYFRLLDGTTPVRRSATILIGTALTESYNIRLPLAGPGSGDKVLVSTNSLGEMEWRGAAGLPVSDTTFIVKGSADPTKLLRFEVDGFSAGIGHVLTPQNTDYTIAGTNITNTFSADQWINNNLKIYWKDMVGAVIPTLWTDGTNNFHLGAQVTPTDGTNPSGGDMIFYTRGNQIARFLDTSLEPILYGGINVGSTPKPIGGLVSWDVTVRKGQNPVTGAEIAGSIPKISIQSELTSAQRFMNIRAGASLTSNWILRFPDAPPGAANKILATTAGVDNQLNWVNLPTGTTVPWVNVKDYGAIGDGASHPISSTAYTTANFPNVPGVASTDEIDWAATQEALYTRPASGGCVYAPSGTYIINKTTQLGNGADQTPGNNTDTRESTLNGQCLFGEGSGHANNSPTILGATVFKAASGFTGTMFQVSGNTYDTQIRDIVIDGADTAAKGVVIRSSYQGKFHNVQVRRVAGTAWRNEKRAVNSIQVCEFSNNAAGCITLANKYKFSDAACLNNFSMISSELPQNQNVIGFDMDVGCSNTIEDSSFYYGGGSGSAGIRLRAADNNMIRRVNVDRSMRLQNGGTSGTMSDYGFSGGYGIYLEFATEDTRMPYENQFLSVAMHGQGIGTSTPASNSNDIGNVFWLSMGDCDGTGLTDVCNGGNLSGVRVQDVWGRFWRGWQFKRGLYSEWGKAGDVAGFYKLSGYFGMPSTFVPNETVPSGDYASGTVGNGWTFNPGATRLYLVSANDQQAGIAIQGFQGNVAFIKGIASQGTLAAPSATLSGDTLFSVGGTGHDGTGFPKGNSAAITFNASQNWTTTAHGSEARIEVTPLGDVSKNRRQAFSFRSNGNTPEMFFLHGGTLVYEGGIRYNNVSSTMQFRHNASSSWTDFGTGGSSSSLYYGYPAGCTPSTTGYNGTGGCSFTVDKTGQTNADATVMHISSLNSQSAGIALMGFGGNTPFIKMAGVGGTVASPSATTSGSQLANYGGLGWSGSGGLGGSSGAMTINSTEGFSTGVSGTEVRLESTPNGMAARRRSLAIQSVCTSLSGTTCVGAIEPYLWFINGGTNVRAAGLRYNAGAAKMQFTHDGTTWTDLGGSASGGYATVQDEGVNLAARTTINFLGTGVTCTDDAGNTRTNCTFTGSGGSVDFTNIASNVYPATDNIYALGSSTRRWASVIGTHVGAIGSNITVEDTSGTIRASVSTFGFYGYNATGAQRVSLDPFSGLEIRNASGLPAFSVDTTGTVSANGSPGLNTAIGCGSGQAIKTLTVTNGIVTGASCGAP